MRLFLTPGNDRINKETGQARTSNALIFRVAFSLLTTTVSTTKPARTNSIEDMTDETNRFSRTRKFRFEEAIELMCVSFRKLLGADYREFVFHLVKRIVPMPGREVC